MFWSSGLSVIHSDLDTLLFTPAVYLHLSSEVDAIVDSVKGSLCCLCATVVNQPSQALCPDCFLHITTDHNERGLAEEPKAEDFLTILGLTEGCKNFPRIDVTDEVVEPGWTDRMMKFSTLAKALGEHSPARARMLWDRFSALYLCHTVDVLIALCQGAVPLASFDCFMWVLNELRLEPFFARFLLSEDPRATGGNKLALVVSEQLMLHAPRWEREAELVPRPPMMFAFMSNACMVLGNVLSVQVDKSAAVPLPRQLHDQLKELFGEWFKKWPQDDTLSEGLRVAATFVREEQTELLYRTRRGIREMMEGMESCARQGCLKARDLYQCERCRVVLQLHMKR